MDLAVCINRAFIQHFHAMITSVVENSILENINVHVIHSDLTLKDQLLIENNLRKYRQLQFQFYLIDKKIFSDIEIFSQHLTVESLYRLDLPNLLSESIDKIIYLDSDLIVLGDIQELFEVNVENSYLAASIEYIPYLAENLELDVLDYFNAGVLVLNLKHWRENHFEKICLDYARTTIKTMYCLDQDILNGVLKGDWVRLGIEWNVVRSCFNETDEYINFLGREKLEILKQNPKIVHFTDYSKPWHFLDDHPKKELYFYYLDLSNYYYVEYPDKQYLEDVLKRHEIFIFGASLKGEKLLAELDNRIIVSGFFDNDDNKINKDYQGYNVFKPRINDNATIIIIGSQYINEISEQLEKLGYIEGVSYFKDYREFRTKIYNSSLKSLGIDV